MEGKHLCLFMMLCLGVHKSSPKILRRQKRDWIIDSFKIHESYKGPFPYKLGTIHLDRNFTFFEIEGMGVLKEPIGTLRINDATGEVYLLKPVDYETYPVLKLKFKAIKKANNEIDTQLGVEIIVQDSNDNAPKFVHQVYEEKILESTLQGTDVITIQATDDDSGENGKIDIRMTKVTPKHENVEFYLTQMLGRNIAVISFRGCLEHMTANRYDITVVATDRGKDVQLSSSSTVRILIGDGNNHLPEITGTTGPGRVKEGEDNVVVLNVQVKDEDSKGTRAWKAKYTIHGDTKKNFKITTDPETNDGILVVEKHLDYEDSSQKKLNITVENEIPFQICKVKTRKTNELWDVIISDKGKSHRPYTVTVDVEDVNEAPVFHEYKKKVSLKENMKMGQDLATFKAEDHDANTIEYRIEGDEAGWVTVDPVTGKVTTAKPLDRESPFVTNNTYVVHVIAADNGKPPMEGTATLTIQIMDDNDNSPYLAVNTLDICQSDKQSKAKLEALDLDEGVYAGPFSYTLLGDVKGKWRVEPPQGHSVNLIKESQVHSGHFELQLEVSDFQHVSAVHNLSVTVCECINPEVPNCRIRKSTGAAAGGTFIGILFLAFLLIAGILLLALLLSCKQKSDKIAEEQDSEQHLMNCNIEIPGEDCKVKSRHKPKSQNEEKIKRKSEVQKSSAPQPMIKTKTSSVSQAMYERAQTGTLQQQANYQNTSMGASTSMRTRQQMNGSTHRSSRRQSKHSAQQNSLAIQGKILPQVMKTKLYNLQASGQELVDYTPHVYAEEQNTELNYDLDAISIPDIPFNPDMVVDSRFAHLASICIPHMNSGHTEQWTNLKQQR